MPPKRKLDVSSLSPSKKPRRQAQDIDLYYRIATFENASRVLKNPPVAQLQAAMVAARADEQSVGSSVVYWMRMEDMRIEDNRALSAASSFAKKNSIPLLVLFIFSPQDYKAHDRGPRRIDFTLRNLSVVWSKLSDMDIPLVTLSHSPRKTLPEKVIELMETWGSKGLYANAEYEVDEARRDLRVLELGSTKGISTRFFADKLVVEPNQLLSQQGRAYSVYSPWLRAWKAHVDKHPECLKQSDNISPNSPSVRNDHRFSSLFERTLPKSIPGFELEDQEKMEELWPAGTDAARDVLFAFLNTRYRVGHLDKPTLLSGAKTASKPDARLGRYHQDRNMADRDSSSRLSPYLAAGVISARELVRETMKFLNVTKVDVTRENGAGVWVQEIAWRDFYTHVLAAFPHVSMGRPFNEKFDGIKWEVNLEHFEAWKDGKTGYPIVDAAMRQLKVHGWMHNRTRMIVAMFLTKDLMLDWRLGEKYFSEQLIDADLASNNGGWQWSASTGTDPQPYFRVFNPTLQSEKADPTGDLIRYFVPELAGLKGKAIHDPINNLSPSEFKKLGYPKPIVDHKSARERAIRRYKNPGEE